MEFAHVCASEPEFAGLLCEARLLISADAEAFRRSFGAPDPSVNL